MPTNSDIQSPTRPRLAWVDFARGMSMILVVMMHLQQFHIDAVVPSQMALQIWDIITSAARPMRMPLFFAISGMLAAHVIAGRGDSKFAGRVYDLIYLYMFWLLIYAVLAQIGLQPGFVDDERRSLADYAWQIIWPNTVLWYLYATILYLLALRVLTRFAPASLVIIMAAVLSGISETIPIHNAPGIARGFFFFAVGAYFPVLFSRIALKSTPIIWLAAAASYVASVALILMLGENALGVWLPAGLIAIWLGVTTAELFSRVPALSFVSTIGRQTLPIFVLHGLLIAFLNVVAFGSAREFFSSVMSQNLIAAVYPIGANIAALAASVGIYTVAKRLQLQFLFHPVRLYRPWEKGDESKDKMAEVTNVN